MGNVEHFVVDFDKLKFPKIYSLCKTNFSFQHLVGPHISIWGGGGEGRLIMPLGHTSSVCVVFYIIQFCVFLQPFPSVVLFSICVHNVVVMISIMLLV